MMSKPRRLLSGSRLSNRLNSIQMETGAAVCSIQLLNEIPHRLLRHEECNRDDKQNV
jgi:hypothetical protein